MTTGQVETPHCIEKDSQGTFECSTRGFCWSWSSLGALFGMIGGIVAALVGSIVTGISWIMGSNANAIYAQTMGTDFLLLTIPLLILGAHCLDVVEKREKVRKESESCENRYLRVPE